MTPPKAVFFDLYETLITEFDPHWQPGASPSVAEQIGMDDEVFTSAWRSLRHERETGVLPDFPSALREICQITDHPLNETQFAQLHKERLDSKAKPFAQIDEGVMRMLQVIRQMGVKMGVISNCMAEEVAAWETSSLAPIFDSVVFSYQAGCMKPDPKIYHRACRKMGVEPEQSLFVGDGGSDELTGAAQVSMTPYWARWFLDRWPAWFRSSPGRERSDLYIPLRTPEALIEIVAGCHQSD